MGEDHPTQGREYRTGETISQPIFAVGQYRINGHKQQDLYPSKYDQQQIKDSGKRSEQSSPQLQVLQLPEMA